MDLRQRLVLLSQLGEYIQQDSEEWIQAKAKAYYENKWFTEDFIALQSRSIAEQYLDMEALEKWTCDYHVPDVQTEPKNVGIVMAGNLPLVGFHDFLTVFVSGHSQTIKLSSKDEILLKHLVDVLSRYDAGVQEIVSFAPMLKGCDAYIATGSNNSSRYFEYYFNKYPNIIRRNRTSAAILTGNETIEELEKLADDVYQFFGLGCRNVTKLYVPRHYDFLPLLNAFRKYNFLFDHPKYKNNYDYQLAILITNSRYYMTNGSIILLEEPSLFSPISQLNYEYYNSYDSVMHFLKNNRDIQCIVGKGYTPFGNAQKPLLTDYADGRDTLQFLLSL